MDKRLVFWVIVDLILLIGCIFVVGYWFEITIKLKDPCGICIKENPFKEDCFKSSPIIKYKINLSG